MSDRVTLVSRNIPLDGADFLRSESGPWTGETPVQASSGEAREFAAAAPRGSAQGQGTRVALGPGGRGRLPLSPKLTVLLSSSNTLLKNVFFCKWMGVFSYTLFLVKHEKGRMPSLVGHTYIYSGGGPPQSLCGGGVVSMWHPCVGPPRTGTLICILSLRHSGGRLNSNWLIRAHFLC